MVQKYGLPVHEFSMSKAPLLTNLSERSRQFCELGGVDFNSPRFTDVPHKSLLNITSPLNEDTVTENKIF